MGPLWVDRFDLSVRKHLVTWGVISFHCWNCIRGTCLGGTEESPGQETVLESR